MIIAHRQGFRAPGNGTGPQGACPCDRTQKAPLQHLSGADSDGPTAWDSADLVALPSAWQKYGTSDFLACLHRRITDRIAWPHGRAWLQNYSHLDLGERDGWPVLVLELEEAPDPHWILPKLLHEYKEAAISGKASGPLSDLAGSLELREAGR